MSAHGWDASELMDSFLLDLGRGNGGVMTYDELFTEARCWSLLANAQERLYRKLSPRVPHAFVTEPTLLTSSDGGITYDFPAYPFGHVEVYATENGALTLYGTNYGTVGSGGFVFEADKIRMPGNRPRTFASGPYARYCGFPARLSATQEPQLLPYPAREMIKWEALILASNVNGAQFDAAPWREMSNEAQSDFLLLYKTQLAAPMAGQRGVSWMQTLSALNGLGG